MIIYPAIDILGGKAVQLRQGDFGRSQVYVEDALEAARRWVGEGARALHVVDLDGAKEGRPVNLEQLRGIAAEASVPVQYGGGLRSLEDVQTALAAGAERVVLGTAAFEDAELLERVIEQSGERVAVSVDLRDGFVSTSGWMKQTDTPGGNAIRELKKAGVRKFIYTNVDRDGMLTGPDPDEVTSIAEVVGDDRFLYSGGVASLDDLRMLVELELPNLAGVILGTALYEGRIELAEASRVLDEGRGEAPSS